MREKIDRVHDLPHGKVRITGDADDRWLVTWLPDEGLPGYPGHTYDSETYGIPTDQGLDGILQWVHAQSWSKPPVDI